MKITNIFIAWLLFIFSSVSQAVVIEGREWRQLTDTLNYSWNQVSSVCSPSSGACNGTIGSVHFSSWTWASIFDVADLFTYFDPNPPYDLVNWNEVDSEWAPLFFNKFNPTESSEDLFLASGITRSTRVSTFTGVETALYAELADRTTDLSNDYRFTRLFFLDLDSIAPTKGHWLYRDVDVTPVPIPSTFLLMIFGLLGLGLAKILNKPGNREL